MADYEFTFHGEPQRYVDIVQRLAVLYPLRKRSQGFSVTAETIKLQEQWRARIGNLTNQGWLSGNTSHSVLYARNCVPTFALANPITRTCRNYTICPFCYARRVREVWQRIDSCFPAPDPVELTEEEQSLGREFRNVLIDPDDTPTTQRQPEFRYHMLFRKHTFNREVTDGNGVIEALRKLMQQITSARASFIRLIDPVGALLYTTFEPNTEGTKWVITNRQLLKIRADVATPERLTAVGKCERIERPTRKLICRYVAQTCRYPVGLMTGDPERTKQLLETKKSMKFRTHMSYRGFRRRRY